jgi:hypothetical protein
MSEELVKLFEKKRHKMERAFRKTSLSKQGWNSNMYRASSLSSGNCLLGVRNMQTAHSGSFGQRSLHERKKK